MSKQNFYVTDKKRIADLPPAEKIQFIWDYYKWPILIVAFVIVAAISTIFGLLKSKEVVLSGYLFDSYYTSDHDEPFYEFSDFANLDTASQQTEFLANLTLFGIQTETAQQLFATISAGQTDFVASNPETFLRLSYDSFKYFYDLRIILTQEQLDQLSDRIFYVDASMLDKLSDPGGTVQLPDPHKPEEMKDPVPIGINIRGGRGVDVLYLGDRPVYLAVVSNAPHLDMTQLLIQFIFSDTE